MEHKVLNSMRQEICREAAHTGYSWERKVHRRVVRQVGGRKGERRKGVAEAVNDEHKAVWLAPHVCVRVRKGEHQGLEGLHWTS